MEVKLLHKDATLGDFQTKGSVGMDLKAITFNGNEMEQFVLMPGEKVTIGTGMAFNMTEYLFPDAKLGALVLPRSGLGTKHDLVLANTVGLIDNDYQGEILVVMKNNSNRSYEIKKLERIAQICFVPFLTFTPGSVRIVDEFTTQTERGANGFGSTGTT